MKVYIQKSKARITERHFQFDPSFGPYIFCLRKKMEESSDIIAKFYRYLIKKFERQPSLLKPFKNVEVLEQHEELIQLLKMSLLPLSESSEQYPLALAFMQPGSLFYYTPSFKKGFIDTEVEFDTKEDEVANLRYFLKLVLKQCYNINFSDGKKHIKQVKDRERGTTNYYQINIDSRFIQVHCDGILPSFEEHWREILNVNDEDFFKLLKSFPSHSFRLEGFCMFSVEDVTKEMAMDRLKDAILNMHATDVNRTVEIVEYGIGELLGDPGVKIEIIPFFKINGRVVYNTSLNGKHLEIPSSEKRLKDGPCIEDIYHNVAASQKPYIISNFDKEFVISRSSLSDIQKHEVKNFLVYPICTKKDGLMGVFELEKGNITDETIKVLQPAFPLITDLIYHMVELFDNKINKLVKEKFTPLLQSVEWKFNEVAWEYLQNEGDKKADDAIGNVVFKHVYPFYGAVDIRDSSVERNNALKNDCINQLTETLRLLERTSKDIALPLLDSLQFKCQRFITMIKAVLTSENEIKISKFFKNEVLVFLKYLQDRAPGFRQDVNDYIQKTNREKGEFHQHLNAYESSVQIINRSIVAFFDEEVEKLQRIYPFYFEKYRTDGLEYNFYLGQSIVPTQPFDKIYIENLRLW
ncbi:MAG TPA: hypothetical protein VF540_11445, partial [Segetibacter sp.]